MDPPSIFSFTILLSKFQKKYLYQLIQNEQNDFQENQVQNQNNQIQHISNDVENIAEEHNQEQNYQQGIPQYTEYQISRYNLQYFNEAISQLKKMRATQQQMRQFIMEYIVEENDLTEEQIQQLSFKQLTQIALENLRPVGRISWLQRKIKVNKYIQKKKKRVWKKKISYDCRKRVADNRLRVKGKFVTKKQACNMLGVEQISQEDLKLLLEAKSSKFSE